MRRPGGRVGANRLRDARAPPARSPRRVASGVTSRGAKPGAACRQHEPSRRAASSMQRALDLRRARRARRCATTSKPSPAQQLRERRRRSRPPASPSCRRRPRRVSDAPPSHPAPSSSRRARCRRSSSPCRSPSPCRRRSGRRRVAATSASISTPGLRSRLGRRLDLDAVVADVELGPRRATAAADGRAGSARSSASPPGSRRSARSTSASPFGSVRSRSAVRRGHADASRGRPRGAASAGLRADVDHAHVAGRLVDVRELAHEPSACLCRHCDNRSADA